MRTAWALAALLAAAAQDRPETVIRTTTRLVQIRVMAETSHGDPISDLRKDEVQLLDNRKPRPIEFLTFENGATPAAAKSPGGGAAAAATEIRNDYAVILLDWLNTRLADRIKVRDYTYKLLKNFQPRQEVALYVLAHKSGLLHDFTSNPEELYQTLAHTEEEPENPFDPAPPAITDPRFKIWQTLTVEERIASFNVKILDTVEALTKLAAGLGRIPGRKSLIWVSSGFPLVLNRKAVPGSTQESVDYAEYAQPLIDRLNRANVAVYSVDARGFAGPGFGDPDTLQEISLRTGGTAFIARNDLEEGMRLALEDSKTGYTLGFTLESDTAPGVHDIRLHTTRPGVILRYRESYELDAR